MVLISFIDGTTLDPRQEEAVAFSNMGNPKYFIRVHDIDGDDMLRAIPEKIVFSRVYPQGDFNLPSPEVYIQEHPEETVDVDWSLMELVKDVH